MNTYTNFQPSNTNNPYNFDQHFNKPLHGSQTSPTNTFTPSNIVNTYPMPSSNLVPNQEMIPPMMLPPPFAMAHKPTLSPPPLPSPTTKRTTTTEPPGFEQPLPSTSNDVNKICGTRHSETEITPLIFGGEETQRGDWPWMVAIYLNKATGLSFNCGGTLISSKTVITAAHCIHTATKNYRAHEVVLYLGRYSLIDWSEVGSIATNVKEIFIHTDYKRQRESFDADIAILIMTKRVDFNEFVGQTNTNLNYLL